MVLLHAVPMLLLGGVLVSTGTEDCELAIIGGGPSGVYTAWRLSVDTQTMPANSICVFERVTVRACKNK